MLSSRVFVHTEPRSVASHSRTGFPHLRPRPLTSSISFRINTCKSVSKQTTLTLFRINTYEKHRGVGVLLLTTHPMRMRILSESAAADESKDLSSHPTSESVLSPFSLHGSRARPPWRITFLLCVSSRRCIIGAHMEFQRIQNAVELFGPPPPAP